MNLIVIEVSKHQTALDLYRRIKSVKEIAETPILMVGSNANQHNPSTTDSSKDDFLERPYDPITLAAKVAKLVERKRTQDELRRFFDLIDNANDVVYTHDLQGRYTSRNALKS
jgi:DNA-binding response OmpR family regulator